VQEQLEDGVCEVYWLVSLRNSSWWLGLISRDLSGDNLPNQPVYVSYNSGEKGCVAACNSYRANGGECLSLSDMA
jgi:hypothetical protein